MDIKYIPLCTRVHLTTCVHKPDLHKTRLFPEPGNEYSSVTSDNVCTKSMAFREMSDAVQTVQPTDIQFTVLMHCLYHVGESNILSV